MHTQDIIKQFGGEVAPLADWQMQALERLGLQHTPLSPPPTSEEAAGTDASRPSATSNNSSAQGPPSTSRLVSPELMYLKAHGMPPVDPRLLAGLRVMLLGEDERFLIQLTPPTAWGAWSAPISQQNEVGVSCECVHTCVSGVEVCQTKQLVQFDRSLFFLALCRSRS